MSYRPGDARTCPTVPEHNGRAYTVGIEIEAILPAYPSDWELTEDASVSGNGGKETVSPILEGTDGIRSAFGAVRAIAKYGAEPVSGGGVHVHIGARSLTVRELANVFRAWGTWGEDVFSGTVPGYRLAVGSYNDSMHGDTSVAETIEDFARSMTRAKGRDIFAEPVSRWADDIGDTFSDRYVSLNPCALSKHGTIEFRIFPSSVDAESVTTWAALCARFVHVARSTDAARVRSILDGFGTLRAGLRILSRGCDSLRATAEQVSAKHARSIPAQFSTRVECDPWGKGPERKRTRMLARKARNPVATCEPETCGGTPYLFPLTSRDKSPEHCEPEPLACHCEPNSSRSAAVLIPYVGCPAHGIPEMGGASLPMWTRDGITFPVRAEDE